MSLYDRHLKECELTEAAGISEDRKCFSQQNLNSTEFMRQFITIDEAWSNIQCLKQSSSRSRVFCWKASGTERFIQLSNFFIVISMAQSALSPAYFLCSSLDLSNTSWLVSSRLKKISYMMSVPRICLLLFDSASQLRRICVVISFFTPQTGIPG